MSGQRYVAFKFQDQYQKIVLMKIYAAKKNHVPTYNIIVLHNICILQAISFFLVKRSVCLCIPTTNW